MNMPFQRALLLILIFISLLNNVALGQPPVKNYDKEWKKVNDLISKQLPKSALPEVKRIYALAKKDKQDAQVIKSLVYMASLQNEIREANKDSSIYEIEKEIPVSQEPAASVLSSLLAGM